MRPENMTDKEILAEAKQQYYLAGTDDDNVINIMHSLASRLETALATIEHATSITGELIEQLDQ